MDRFLTRFPRETHPFFTAVFDTGCFRAFKKTRHPHNLDLFDVAAAEGGFRGELAAPGGDHTSVFIPNNVPSRDIGRSPSMPDIKVSEAEPARRRLPAGGGSSLPGSPELARRQTCDLMISSLTARLDGAAADDAIKVQMLHLRGV